MTGFGLCDQCLHQRIVSNTRGSSFSMCLLARSDPSFRKYPKVPVASCPGFVDRGKGPAGAGQGT